MASSISLLTLPSSSFLLTMLSLTVLVSLLIRSMSLALSLVSASVFTKTLSISRNSAFISCSARTDVRARSLASTSLISAPAMTEVTADVEFRIVYFTRFARPSSNCCSACLTSAFEAPCSACLSCSCSTSCSTSWIMGCILGSFAKSSGTMAPSFSKARIELSCRAAIASCKGVRPDPSVCSRRARFLWRSSQTSPRPANAAE
mmetsp:Transcript_79479/g.140276  ORF Transcript_79479/g.140276 Transcript_79479/m.140276 type:complete len:204 (-) Transcript_79479:1138-1749(-)